MNTAQGTQSSKMSSQPPNPRISHQNVSSRQQSLTVQQRPHGQIAHMAADALKQQRPRGQIAQVAADAEKQRKAKEAAHAAAIKAFKDAQNAVHVLWKTNSWSETVRSDGPRPYQLSRRYVVEYPSSEMLKCESLLDILRQNRFSEINRMLVLSLQDPGLEFIRNLPKQIQKSAEDIQPRDTRFFRTIQVIQNIQYLYKMRKIGLRVEAHDHNHAFTEEFKRVLESFGTLLYDVSWAE